MKPFQNTRVIDLTHVLAGPFCTFQLACLGADVIKVESEQSYDMTRAEGINKEDNKQLYGSYFQPQNAGKRGISIDLNTEPGKEILWRLIKTADVLVQNFSGDKLDRLGFGLDAVQAVNPTIIYCSISGFGTTGPKAHDPAYDNVIQAFSGLMAANGEPDRDPVKVGPPMVDYGTGAQAAFAISAALHQRQRTNKGQFIDVSMLDCALMLMSAMVAETAITDAPPKPHGNSHPGYIGYATYETAEGKLMTGAFTNKQLAALLKVVGLPDRAREVLETDRQEISKQAASDSKIIAGKLLEKSAHTWEELLNAAHVPAARVRTLDETLQEEQLKHRKVLQQLNKQPTGNPHAFPVAGFTYFTDGPCLQGAAPRLGQHTAEVLAELGYTQSEISSLMKS